jgi:hypothetical protein
MLKTQAVAELEAMLMRVTSADRARDAVRRAVRSSGLTHATRLSNNDLHELLAALAAEGGPIQDLAVEIAIYGIDDAGGIARDFRSPPDQDAA